MLCRYETAHEGLKFLYDIELIKLALYEKVIALIKLTLG